MRAFSRLYLELDRATRASDKIAALEVYFRSTPPADAAWALWFLAGRRLKRSVKPTQLRQWVAEVAELPHWLVEECYEAVGDLGEALALLLPLNATPAPLSLAELVRWRLLPLASADEPTQRDLLRRTWSELDTPQRCLWHKLISGGFRVGVSSALLSRALAGVASVEPPVMALRLAGEWRPTQEDFARLLSNETASDHAARPYPFHLASTLESDVRALGDVHDWRVEWMWNGVRAQLIRRSGQAVLWSRAEEIITGRFPEIAEAARALPNGTVLDGGLLAWRDDGPLPFARLRRRLNRQPTGGDLRVSEPVVFMAYDLLEMGGADLRERPLDERRRALEGVWAEAADAYAVTRKEVHGCSPVQGELFRLAESASFRTFPLRVSGLLPAGSWDEILALRDQASAAGAAGIMLKHRASVYGVGRQRGAWWKWNVEPLPRDTVAPSRKRGSSMAEDNLPDRRNVDP